MQYILRGIFLLTAVMALCHYTDAQCPKLKLAMIDGCGRDGDNEFVMFQTRSATVALSTLKLEYSTSVSFPPGSSTVVINPNSSINAWTNPANPPANGLTNSLGTISAIDPTSVSSIGPNQTVVIYPNAGALTTPFDLQTPGSVLVLFYDTTIGNGTSNWKGTGNFTNYGNTGNFLNPRFFRLTTDPGGACVDKQAASYTPSNLLKQNGTPGAEDGARVYWDDATDATVTPSDNDGTVHYFNQGCAVVTLPIHLVFFQGRQAPGQIQLQWETASGSDAVRFSVERSPDGQQFNPIGTVNAGRGEGLQDYSYTDQAPLAGNNFYRLKMLDADGNSTYSNTLSFSGNTSGGVSLSPNPCRDQVTIRIPGGVHTTLTLYSPSGVQRWQQTVDGTDAVSLDLTNDPAGIYVLRVVQGQSVSVHKVFRQ